MICDLAPPDARRGQLDHLATMLWRVLEEGYVKTAPQFEHFTANAAPSVSSLRPITNYYQHL